VIQLADRLQLRTIADLLENSDVLESELLTYIGKQFGRMGVGELRESEARNVIRWLSEKGLAKS